MATRLTRTQLHRADSNKLLQDESFKRWLFTFMDLAGMFNGCFHSEDAVLAYGEGRRSLGLDMLSDLAGEIATKEEVLVALLSAEIKTQKEVQDDRRDRNQFHSDRSRELGGDGDVDDRDRVD